MGALLSVYLLYKNFFCVSQYARRGVFAVDRVTTAYSSDDRMALG